MLEDDPLLRKYTIPVRPELVAYPCGLAAELSFESWSDDEEPVRQSRPAQPHASAPAAGPSAAAQRDAAEDAAAPIDTDSDVHAQLRAATAQIARLKQLLESTLAVEDSSSESDSESASGSSSGAEGSESSHSAASAGLRRKDKGKGRVVGRGVTRSKVNGKGKGKGKGKARVEVRDDDTHYFNSYAQNGASARLIILMLVYER